MGAVFTSRCVWVMSVPVMGDITSGMALCLGMVSTSHRCGGMWDVGGHSPYVLID